VKSPRPGRLGVFGGTFDPPHLGHLLLAECAREALALDRVVFVPARVPPHKAIGRVSPADVRVRLLRAALRGTGFALSTLELSRPGPSYTVDTLDLMKRLHKGEALWLLIGADSLNDLPTWRDPDGILERARLAVAARPGCVPRGVSARVRRAVDWLPNAPVDIASRDLRQRVAAGRSIRFLVPDAVARLVARLGLYGCAASDSSCSTAWRWRTGATSRSFAGR
jgi:nicotinate-nucleotide adenylyltransferase